jgi:hypothetical protein
MKVKVKGKTYEVSTAPPGGSHQVALDGTGVGSFVIEPREIKLSAKGISDKLLLEIAEAFIDLGGAPMGIA